MKWRCYLKIGVGWPDKDDKSFLTTYHGPCHSERTTSISTVLTWGMADMLPPGQNHYLTHQHSRIVNITTIARSNRHRSRS
jgi:hypothetical protein